MINLNRPQEPGHPPEDVPTLADSDGGGTGSSNIGLRGPSWCVHTKCKRRQSCICHEFFVSLVWNRLISALKVAVTLLMVLVPVIVAW